MTFCYVLQLVGIQACQTDGSRTECCTDEQVDAKKAKNELNHVALRADNCSLIMATVEGGFAYRQNFLTAFSKELLDEKSSTIYEIFLATQRRIENDGNCEH